MELFPNDTIFTNLVHLRDTTPGVVVSDKYGIEAGYDHLFDDIAELRQTLRKRLHPESFDDKGLLRPQFARIASFTTSIYYFLVGFFSIASLGGACVPLSTTDTLEETLYFLNKVNPACVLFDPWTIHVSITINNHLHTVPGQHFQTVHLQLAERNLKEHVEVKIDEDVCIPESQPCLIVFSSGTTGKPKGVILPRCQFFFPISKSRRLVNLSYRPVHWISSARAPIRNLLIGSRCVCLERGASPGDVWEALRAGNITDTSITPTRLKAMQEYYLSNIQQMPSAAHDSYVSGFSKLTQLTSTGSMLHPATAKFWKDLTNISIVGLYGTTELAAAAFRTSPDSPHIESCLGKLEPTVQAKLSDGDHGELFLKTVGMFTGYLDDEEATKAIFDEDGFYNTGDIVRRDGDKYFFLGRSSVDWIRFSAFTVSVIELEKRLLELPYVSEAYVLPIMDYEARELVAAVIRLKSGVAIDRAHPTVNLCKIRDDLSSTTEPYKLPRLLRILQKGETVPLTVSEKVLKNGIRQKYFKLSGYRPRDYSVPGVEFFGNETGSQFLADAKKLPSTKG